MTGESDLFFQIDFFGSRDVSLFFRSQSLFDWINKYWGILSLVFSGVENFDGRYFLGVKFQAHVFFGFAKRSFVGPPRKYTASPPPLGASISHCPIHIQTLHYLTSHKQVPLFKWTLDWPMGVFSQRKFIVGDQHEEWQGNKKWDKYPCHSSSCSPNRACFTWLSKIICICFGFKLLRLVNKIAHKTCTTFSTNQK